MTIERRQASRRRDGEKMMKRCDDATMEGIQSSGRRGDVEYGLDFWTLEVLCVISCARIERGRETVIRFKERERGARVYLGLFWSFCMKWT